ncbi:MAG: hypothetical protein HYU78_04775 [Rhodocyclales bacterium]|nr:hypothetical protein [Rhodocyclales bacterium]
MPSVDASVEHSSFAHPASLFASLFDANTEEFVLARLSKQFDEFLERFPYSAYFTSKVASYPAVKAKLLNQLLTNAGASDFGTANSFARHIGDVQKLLLDKLEKEDVFKLLVSVLKAASFGAFAAIDLRNSHFSVVENMREAAALYLSGNPPVAKQAAADILSVPLAAVDAELVYLAPLTATS